MFKICQAGIERAADAMAGTRASLLNSLLPLAMLSLLAAPAQAQSFRVQCPTSTITHPAATALYNAPVIAGTPVFDANGAFQAEPTYVGPTTLSAPTTTTYPAPTANVNGAIKCQQISGGDGYSTMADGTQTYMFSFGPLSGIADIAAGNPGTEYPHVFNQYYSPTAAMNSVTPVPGDPATTDGATDAGAYTAGNGGFQGATSAVAKLATPASFTYNGAIGLAPDIPNLVNIYDIFEGQGPINTFNSTPGAPYKCQIPATSPYGANVVTVVTNSPLGANPGDVVTITGTGLPSAGGYDGKWPVTTVSICNPYFASNFAFQFNMTATNAALAEINQATATAALQPRQDGHVDPRQIMDVAVMNGNIPAPLMAIDEDDEFFLTLTNVGMIMRPDLFEQHTVHFHGYPNASSFYDGVPDASVAINIGGSFTYYYLAPDAGTYFWHCHITPPEHLQMGMVGQIFVRPRQDRVPVGTSLYESLSLQQTDLRTACNSAVDILCSNPLPNTTTYPNVKTVNQSTDSLTNKPQMYVYNDGDGSTAYDVEYPIQMHGFDPNFHFVGMTFNPEAFVDMKDKYFLLNGRSYPDTVNPGPQLTQSSDGRVHFSQPLNSIINIPVGGKALLRLSQLSVSEYHTLASLGIPMHIVGYNAKLLRDQDGNNMDYYANSITIGGGESLDAILDASNTTLYPVGSKFYLYSPNLDHLSNDAENFGGEMTEVNICNSVDPITKVCS